MTAKKSGLKSLRKRIDAIDDRILELLDQRAGVVHEVGAHKRKHNDAVYAPDRERDVYRRILAKNKGLLPDDSVQAIFREIMSSALRLEEPITVAYLGPEFTFTHIASTRKFGASIRYVGCRTITDVFNEVAKRRADYGVVPIENSIEGAVNHTLDMFIDSDLKICSEIFSEISHNLLSKEKSLAKIRRVYSKPEAFGQCRLWIEANIPDAELVEASSTARAAEIAAKERSSACFASELAARRYGLKVLCRSVEDSSHNVTRFLVIGKADAMPTGDDKTSIMFSIKDKAGALHDALIPFKKHHINMTKIESRPSKVRAWEYYFFVDVEGHWRHPRLAKALSELKRGTSFLKILGSYPISTGL